MKRTIFMVLSTLSFGCSGQSHNPLYQVNVRASEDVQSKVLEETKKFGIRNGFEVHETGSLPKDGRLVSQVLLTRSDGVLVVSQNFMSQEVLETGFYAEKAGADWGSVKDKWLFDIKGIIGEHGEIITVVPPSGRKTE